MRDTCLKKLSTKSGLCYEDNRVVSSHPIYISTIYHTDIWLFNQRRSHFFKKLYGRATQVIDFSHRNWVWAFEVNGFIFQAMDSIRGTSYEVLYAGGHTEFINDKEVGISIQEFFTGLKLDLLSLPELQEEYEVLDRIHKCSRG